MIAITNATAAFTVTYWASDIGVRPSCRPQPCIRSTAAIPPTPTVAVTAPKAAIEIIVYMAAFPLPTGASDQAIAAPKTMYMKAGRSEERRVGKEGGCRGEGRRKAKDGEVE